VTQPGGPDLIGDFQRWLLRTGARGMSRQLTHQVRTALGRNQEPSGDVWETATTEPLPGEAPECAWCPLCRAARLVREAKPGRDTRVTAVGDALNTVVQDAVSVLEAALAATGRATGPNGRKDETGPGTRGFPAAGEAGSGGKATPVRDKPAAPAEGKPAAPAEGKPAAPAEGKPAAPAEGKPAAPAEGKPAAPAKDKPAAPAKAKQAAPATDKAEPPAKNKPAPATEERAAPEPGEESPHEPDDRG
jgi:hypothetical protein